MEVTHQFPPGALERIWDPLLKMLEGVLSDPGDYHISEPEALELLALNLLGCRERAYGSRESMDWKSFLAGRKYNLGWRSTLTDHLMRNAPVDGPDAMVGYTDAKEKAFRKVLKELRAYRDYLDARRTSP